VNTGLKKSEGEKENGKNLNLQKEFLTENIDNILGRKNVEYPSLRYIYFCVLPYYRYFENQRRNTY
jgi:hypothetical protein